VVAIIMVFELALVVGPRYFGLGDYPKPAPKPAGYSNTESLGALLYTDYLYAFEVAAVILLVAIIAAIGLTLRRRPDTRYVDPSRQVVVKREDRVRLVKVAPEQKLEFK
jgi:NADH-quinone oxidoreductase subunit J